MISAFCFLAARRVDADSHRLVGVGSMAAAGGGEKEVKAQLEQWEEEAS